MGRTLGGGVGLLLVTLSGGCTASVQDEETTSEVASDVAAARTIKIVHWNISGAVLNKGFNDVVDKMMKEIDARKPDVISINEACRDQVEYLRNKLRSKGHATTLQFAPTGNNAACIHSLGTNTMQAGPAILAVAGGKEGLNHYWQGTKSVDSRTDRGMACLSADLGKKTRLCSLHLATGDGEAAAQVESLIARFGGSFRSEATLLIGDFNAAPAFFKEHAPNLYAPQGLFFEADAKNNKATHGEGKLDFVFMSKGHFLDTGTFDVKDMGQHDPWWGSKRAYSDHRLVYSEVSLKL